MARRATTPCAACPEPQILPENELALTLFTRSGTQWNYSAMGIRTGLNYSGVEVVALRIMSAADWDDAFLRLQILEAAFLKIDGEKHGDAGTSSQAQRPG